MKTFKAFISEKKKRCWKGYKPVKGKKAYSKGSCVKEFTIDDNKPHYTPEEGEETNLVITERFQAQNETLNAFPAYFHKSENEGSKVWVVAPVVTTSQIARGNNNYELFIMQQPNEKPFATIIDISEINYEEIEYEGKTIKITFIFVHENQNNISNLPDELKKKYNISKEKPKSKK